MRGYHDIGGLPGGKVPRDAHEMLLWEKRVLAIEPLMIAKTLVRPGESRRAIESLGAELYAKLSYTELRVAAIANDFVARGFFTVDELNRKLADVEARQKSRL